MMMVMIDDDDSEAYRFWALFNRMRSRHQNGAEGTLSFDCYKVEISAPSGGGGHEPKNKTRREEVKGVPHTLLIALLISPFSVVCALAALADEGERRGVIQ